jgi:hypothetical protein
VLLDSSLYFLDAFSMLVNDTPTSFFSSSCDLRQGNPMSPLFFFIVIEALGRMISAAMSGGLLFTFSVGTGIDFSHLLFVDDTLIFIGVI